ncbi:IS66 family transposase [Klebsiella pneumoniae]|nr:IS66 family transposase [Klebsiella pneumoniae]MBV0695449.1 IS66 family transposase [Klebsiella pneumoniae]MBV0700732.1 IS66 family transposase [Klebsiella pneumoniae]
MNHDYLARIAALEDALRQKDSQLSLVAETESFLRSALARAEEKIENEEREIEHLRAQIEKLRRMLFGTRSEKLRRQVEEAEALLKQQEQQSDRYNGREDDPQVPRQLRQSRHRRPLPAHLPREIIRLEPAETCCPDCGSDMSYLSEVSAEQLELVSSALKVIRTVRVKKACTRCDCIVEAPAPSRPIDRGIAGPGLLARVLTAKYCEHLPLYRQCEIFARQGVDLSRALLSNWVDACCRLMAPLEEALQDYVLTDGKLHADDTPVQELLPGNKKTKTGRLWTYVRDDRNAGSALAPAVWFAYSPDRKGIHPQTHLAGFSGVLQADAYAGFNELYRDGRITEAACWAHARRKIHDVHVRTPSALTEEALKRIGELYAVEAEIRGMLAEQRLAERQRKTKPLLSTLESWLREKMKTLSRHSELAKAFTYTLNQWPALTYYAENGWAEADNNIAENALRMVSLGRKNWLFFGSDHGGERGALLYSLIGTCKLNGVDPESYLRHVLDVIADWPVNRVSELLPWRITLPTE